MQLLIELIIKIFSNPAGQAALTWLGGKIWARLNEAAQAELSKKHVEEAVKKAMEDYEKVLEDQIVLAKDGLSDDEKNEIRRRKAEAQARIINARN